MLGTPNVGQIFLFVFCMFLQDFGVQMKKKRVSIRKVEFCQYQARVETIHTRVRLVEICLLQQLAVFSNVGFF